jgi:hypothetical protein
MKSGAILYTAGLQPTAKGKRIRLTKGKISARRPVRRGERVVAATRSENSPHGRFEARDAFHGPASGAGPS